MLERLRARFASGRLARRVAISASWMLADRIVRALVGFLVGVWVARYLGPGELGRLAFAFVLVGLLSVMVDLALEQVVVRELVRRPNDRARILGTALGLRLIGAVLGLAAVTASAYLLDHDDLGIVILCFAVATSFLATPVYVVEFLFQSRLTPLPPILARSVGFVASTAMRVALILVGASTLAFAWVPLVEGTLTAIALIVALRADGSRISQWRFDTKEARALLRTAAPLVLAAFAMLATSRVDQLVVGSLLGDSALGVYSAASRVTEAATLIATAMASALVPAVMALKAHEPQRFAAELRRVVSLLFYAGGAIALPVSLLAQPLVATLYGERFAEAAPLLAVQIWSIVFVFMNAALGAILVAEDRPLIALARAGAGLIVVTLAALLLVPRYGAIGAAWASLAASAVTVYSLALLPGVRSLGRSAITAPLGLVRRR